jgi:hypothetical protein
MLSDGRRLAYHVYGAPLQGAAQRAVLYFHGVPSCHVRGGMGCGSSLILRAVSAAGQCGAVSEGYGEADNELSLNFASHASHICGSHICGHP